MLESSGEEIVAVLGDVVCEVDRRALSGALGEFIVRELAHSLATGVWGWFDDDRAILGDWGFELHASPRARCRSGTAGRTDSCRSRTGEWLAARLGRRGPSAAGRRTPVARRSVRYGEILDVAARVGCGRVRRDASNRVTDAEVDAGDVPPKRLRAAHAARAAGRSDGDLAETLEGTMVFADVSGFTRLSERLARKGKEGAEHLVDAINACFSALLADAYEPRRVAR